MLQSIQAKLVVLVAVAILLLGGAGFWGIYQQAALSGNYRALIEDDATAQHNVDMLAVGFKTQVQEWKNLLLRSANAADVERNWQTFAAVHAKNEAAAAALVKDLSASSFKSMAEQFKSTHQSLLPKYQQGKEAFVAAGLSAQAGEAALKDIDREASQQLEQLSSALDQHQKQQIQQLSKDSSSKFTEATLVFFGVALGMMIGLATLLSQLVMQPIKHAIHQIGALAAGNFNIQLDVHREDEIGQLNRSLEKMKEELGGMIASIRTTADALMQVNQQLHGSANDINRDTAQTENFAGQIASAITEMTATVNEVARNAAHAAEATTSADKGAREGLNIMTSAISAITRVADEVAQTSMQMSKLKDDSTSVGAVLDVIKGIAEQTNLLALNAAIEAARAGEQGRGFAVVADEVRALAKRTQESTEEIQQIIKTLQDGAAAATQAMSQSTYKTRDAVQLAEKAGGTINEISNAIGLVRDMNNQIAAAAEEQSVAAEEINRNVNNMSELAENAHGNARKTGSVAKSLEQTSRDLHTLVGGFRI